MVLAAKTLRVDFVDVLGAGRPGGEPAARGDHLDAADRCVVPRSAVEHLVDSFAANSVMSTCCGESFASFCFCSAVAGASTRPATGSPRSRVKIAIQLSGIAASRAR